LKGWDVGDNEAAFAALQAYFETGPVSLSAMSQRDTPEQKLALCRLIDAIDGEIYDDWNGGTMAKEAAKEYVMNYGVK
jgi:hypothetical protein